MKKKYELVVKGINNYPDKITVTVALEIGGYPSLLLPESRRSSFSWMLLPGYVKGMVRCRKSGPSF